MIYANSSSRLKDHRFPKSIISFAVWAYHRFALSLRDVEDLLAERGVIVRYETIRTWVGKFGSGIAKRIRAKRQPFPTQPQQSVCIRVSGQTNNGLRNLEHLRRGFGRVMVFGNFCVAQENNLPMLCER